MRGFLWSMALLAGALVVVLPVVRSQSNSRKPAPLPELPTNAQETKTPADRSADEAAIRANVDAFVKAYNAKDAKAVAALFAPDGQTVNKDREVTEGREAIERVFANLFSNNPRTKTQVTVESIRFIGSDLAVEEGSTKETSSPGEPPDYDRYTVLHVKRDGKWQMAMARDEEGPAPSAHEQLRALAWLVGDWVDDGGSTVVRSTCRWSDDKNFLLQEFDVQTNGKEAMHVSQRIGWDPLGKRIRGWVFDSEGGFGESQWTRDGDIWVIKATAVRPDGTTASATNTLVPAGKDAYVWRSRDRIVDDEVVAPVEVKVVRKPPEPKR